MQNRSARFKFLGAREVAVQMLEYLGKHPYAMDTVEGIAPWWVHKDGRQVQTALALLLYEEILEEKVLYGKRYYLLNKNYRDRPLEDAVRLIQVDEEEPPKQAGRRKKR